MPKITKTDHAYKCPYQLTSGRHYAPRQQNLSTTSVIVAYHNYQASFECSFVYIINFAIEIPWNYMELWSRQIKNHRVPRDSMELGGRHFK